MRMFRKKHDYSAAGSRKKGLMKITSPSIKLFDCNLTVRMGWGRRRIYS